MKVTIALIILGAAGLVQYAYFQQTPLAYSYAGYVIEGGIGTILWVRDWTVGLVGAVIGAILLGIGLYRLKHRKPQQAATLERT